jgi:hypothetical protein
MQSIVVQLNNLLGQVTSHALAENCVVNKASAIHANVTKISYIRDNFLICHSLFHLMFKLSVDLNSFEVRKFTNIDFLRYTSAALSDLCSVVRGLR